MTDLCSLLDAYRDGALTDDQSERFEVHAADCDACDAALERDTDLAAFLAGLSDVTCPPAVLASVLSATEAEWPGAWGRELRGLARETCPPEVLAAAVRQTRRAPDRGSAHVGSARSHVRAVTRWAVGLAALIALAMAWNAWFDAERPAPQIAQTVPPLPVDSSATPAATPLRDAAPAPTRPEADAVARAAPRPDPAPPASVTPPTPSVTLPTTPPREQVARAAAPDEAISEAAADVANVDEPPSAQAIEAARDDLALAFALIDDAQSHARSRIRSEAGPISSTLDQALPF